MRALIAAFVSQCLRPSVGTSTVIPLEIWDCPGNITVEALNLHFSQFSTIIFVIDIRVCLRSPRRIISILKHALQDLYNQPISKLVDFLVAAYRINPNVNLEVFVHKAEKLQEDDKIGMRTRFPTVMLPILCFPFQRKFQADSRACF